MAVFYGVAVFHKHEAANFLEKAGNKNLMSEVIIIYRHILLDYQLTAASNVKASLIKGVK